MNLIDIFVCLCFIGFGYLIARDKSGYYQVGKKNISLDIFGFMLILFIFLLIIWR